MATNVIMPQMGESIFEGTVTRWLKKVGEPVKRDEPLFEISTDKVDSEIPSPAAGVLTTILVPEGQTVQVNTVVAVLDGETGASVTPSASEVVATAPPVSRPPAATPAPHPPQPEARPAPSGELPEDIRSSPLVRKMAREYNLELTKIKGTGLGNRITKQDIETYLADAGVQPLPPGAPPPSAPSRPAPKPIPPGPTVVPPSVAPPTTVATPAPSPPPASPASRVTIEPMSTMRKQISEHMVMSKRTSAHVNTIFEVDVTNVVKLREREQQNFQRTNGVKLTFTAFLAKAVADTLREFPILNSSVEGNNIVYKKDINVGIAVALDWGLIVPVIKNAEDKSFVGVAKTIADLAERARTKKLKPEEVQNGTFTITNPGIFGSLFGTPIINQPQVAILGVGSITKRPVVIENDAIAIRSMVILSLSFDHRVVDGAVADQFMAALKKRLENWKSL
jgi:pyruvate dehydrogenase E2 component (dihydrolipoamide acetyltransferase)